MDLNPDIDIEASVEARTRQHQFGMVKCYEDARRYEALMMREQFSLVVEVGTFSGKSAAWFAQYAPVLTIDTQEVHSIEPDIDILWGQTAHPVRQTVSRSIDPAAQLAIHESAQRHAGAMLLILDGDHAAATVAFELMLYAHLATYIVVEDTLLRWFPEDEQVYDGNPLDALEAWLPEHPEWTVDRETESMYPVTQHIAGWLRRTDRE